jgi:hypothetical protein
MIKFLQIPEKERKVIYQDVSNKLGVPPQAVEKDVWVTLMLRVFFLLTTRIDSYLRVAHL